MYAHRCGKMPGDRLLPSLDAESRSLIQSSAMVWLGVGSVGVPLIAPRLARSKGPVHARLEC